MGGPAEILHRFVQNALFQKRMSRTPQAQVDDGAGPAVFKKCFFIRSEASYRRDESLPGFFKGSFSQVIHEVRMIEG